MDNFGGTAGAVLNFLKSFKLKRERSGQYRCNSPLRPGSDSMSFVLKLKDDEHGAYYDHVDGDLGTLYDLAQKIDISINPKKAFSPPSSSKSTYSPSKKGLTLQEFADHKKIPINFLIELGFRQVLGKLGHSFEVRIPYFNPDGTLFRERIRYALRAKDGSAWADGNGVIPFGLNRIQNASYCLLFEGESDAFTCWLYGFFALGLPGASSCGCLQLAHIQTVRTLYYWKEPDKGGETFAKKLLQRLADIGFTGECYEISVDDVKDVSELYLKDPENFKLNLSQTLENARLVTLPSPTAKIEVAQVADDLDTEDFTPWPLPLSESALYGVTGDIIRAIEPHTEADYNALLLQFLACLGSLIGKKPYYVLDGSKHYTNIYLIVVGASSTGRKGTSLQHVKNLLEQVDPTWLYKCTAEGLSSGEGLIYRVRDAVSSLNKEGIEVITDLGCEDKRIMVMESEFANLLAVMTRQGNTISPILRRAWNGEVLSTLTKNSPLTATNALLSLIGHISKLEYLKNISATETSNGFVNRFIHCMSKRSKSLPLGGALHLVDFAPIINHLCKVVEFAKTLGQMRMDENAIELWKDNYEHLVGEGKRTGLFAEVTARATGHVIRLAMLYSILDFSSVIRPMHLLAALECWRYAEDSAKYVFGDMSSDPISEKIFSALKSSQNGLTQDQLYNLFSRNISSSRIKTALTSLSDSGQIGFSKNQSDNPLGGRPRVVWFVLKQK